MRIVLVTLLLLVATSSSTALAGWTSPERVSTYGQGGAKLGFDRDGTLVVAWKSPPNVRVAVRPPGRTFRAPEVVGPWASTFALAAGPGRRLELAASARKGIGIYRLGRHGRWRLHDVIPAVVPSHLTMANGPRGEGALAWLDNGIASDGLRMSLRPSGGRFGRPRKPDPRGVNPAVAIDGLGGVAVAWASGGYDRPYVSNAIGVIAGPRVGALGRKRFLGSGSAVGAPELVARPEAGTLLAWAEDGDGRSLFVARRRARADHFHRTQALPRGHENADQIDLAGGGGRVVAAWLRSDGDDSRVESASAGEGVFGPPGWLSPPGWEAGSPTVAIDTRGRTVALWPEHDEAAGRLIGYVRSGGSASHTVIVAGASVSGVDVAAGPRGVTAAAWTRVAPGRSRIEVAEHR